MKHYKAIIISDASFCPITKTSGYSTFILTQDKIKHLSCGCNIPKTPQEAEYNSCVLGIDYCHDNGIVDFVIFCDELKTIGMLKKQNLNIYHIKESDALLTSDNAKLIKEFYKSCHNISNGERLKNKWVNL